MTKRELKLGFVFISVCTIVFLAGYQLGKEHYERVSTIPVLSVAEHEEKMREAAVAYKYPGTLGFPLGTPLIIEGAAYIDGAGFPLQDDLLAVSSVTCNNPNVTLTIKGGRVPEGGIVRYKGHETVSNGKRQFVVSERLQ
jgi:hypothetical protein